MKVLLETDEFTSDAVSDGGEVPIQAEAFRLLFREEPVATGAAFLYLAAQGTPAGKLFGVCGLWFTDPEAFELECSWMAREPEDEKVMMFEGCIRGERPLAGIVRCTGGNPVVRLKDRSQTVRQWFAETGTESACFDIEGGAWPSILRGGDPGEP